MNYYDTKRQAMQIIDKMITDGKNYEEIVYKISLTFGFGEKIVKERIALLEALAKKRTK